MENIAFILIILIYIVAIIVNIHLVNVERKYCKHCEWWSEIGAFIVVAFGFVPILGIVVPIGFSVDCMRNVIEQIKGGANG